MMLVADRMTRRPVTIGPGDSLALAHFRMKAGGFRRLPVVQKGQVVGILSEYALQGHLADFHRILVDAAMTRDPIVVSSEATLEHAATLMSTHRIGALPVVDHGQLVGILSAGDMMLPEPRLLPEWVPPKVIS